MKNIVLMIEFLKTMAYVLSFLWTVSVEKLAALISFTNIKPDPILGSKITRLPL